MSQTDFTLLLLTLVTVASIATAILEYRSDRAEEKRCDAIIANFRREMDNAQRLSKTDEAH